MKKKILCHTIMGTGCHFLYQNLANNFKKLNFSSTSRIDLIKTDLFLVIPFQAGKRVDTFVPIWRES
jgi:hypothetical protein